MKKLILLTLIGLISCKKQENNSIPVKSTIPIRIYISGKDASYGYIQVTKEDLTHYYLYDFPKDILSLDTTLLFDVGDNIRIHIYYNDPQGDIKYSNDFRIYQGNLKKEDINRFGELNTTYTCQ